jgi:hypothetical protein
MRFRAATDWIKQNAAVLLVVLAIVSGYSYWYQVNQTHQQSERLNRISECQHQYNIAFDTQLRIRSELFQAADDTRNDLLGGVAALILAPRDPNEAPEVKKERDTQFRTLFEDYLEATSRVEAARENTPLPPIPNCR